MQLIAQAPTRIATSDCPVEFSYNGITYDGGVSDEDSSRYSIQVGDQVTLVAACWKPDIFMAVVQRGETTHPLVLRVASWDKLQYACTDEAGAEYAKAQAKAAEAKKAEAKAAKESTKGKGNRKAS